MRAFRIESDAHFSLPRADPSNAALYRGLEEIFAAMPPAFRQLGVCGCVRACVGVCVGAWVSDRPKLDPSVLFRLVARDSLG